MTLDPHTTLANELMQARLINFIFKLDVTRTFISEIGLHIKSGVEHVMRKLAYDLYNPPTGGK